MSVFAFPSERRARCGGRCSAPRRSPRSARVAVERDLFVPRARSPTPAQPAAGPASFADIVDRVKASVVSVKVKLSDAGDDGVRLRRARPPASRRAARSSASSSASACRRPTTATPSPPRMPTHGAGLRLLHLGDGYIVTNNHVVEHATEVTVTTSDGKTLDAKVIGVDPKTDLALLKVEGDNFPSVSFAAKAPRVGDWVIAVGNPFGLGGTVTAGIVSARGRDIGSGPYDDFIQIDAPVNHGNSGGPTFNNDGEVVGVNTAIFSPSGGSVGIGFAIASDVVKTVVRSSRRTARSTRGWLGVEIQPVTPELADSLGVKDDSGALVAKETADSPAATRA